MFRCFEEFQCPSRGRLVELRLRVSLVSRPGLRVWHLETLACGGETTNKLPRVVSEKEKGGMFERAKKEAPMRPEWQVESAERVWPASLTLKLQYRT